jgi:acyl carrier protein
MAIVFATYNSRARGRLPAEIRPVDGILRPSIFTTARVAGRERHVLLRQQKDDRLMKDITEQLREFVTENFLFGQEVTIGDDDSFLDQGIIDSTGVLELVTFIEDKYQITVDDSELVPDNLDSIQKLLRFIQSKREPCATAAAD